MPAPAGDPTYIKNREKYFMSVAKAIEAASSHPRIPGGCIIVRDREIIGDGRSILTDSKVEIDCLTYAIGAACKRGTPSVGAEVFTTRYPFSPSIFQCWMMGIKKIYVLSHEWDPFYKDEYRRAARLARELFIAIEPLFEDQDKRFGVNANIKNSDDDPSVYEDENPYTPDEYDPATQSDILDENTSSL